MALAPLRSTSKRASSSPAVVLNMRREIKRIDVSTVNVDRLDGNLFLYRHPRSVSSIVFISGRTLESVLCGVHSKPPVTLSVSVMDVIKRHCHVLLAHAQEAADRHYEGRDLSVLIHQDVADFADLILGRIIDVLFIPVRYRGSARWQSR